MREADNIITPQLIVCKFGNPEAAGTLLEIAFSFCTEETCIKPIFIKVRCTDETTLFTQTFLLVFFSFFFFCSMSHFGCGYLHKNQVFGKQVSHSVFRSVSNLKLNTESTFCSMCILTRPIFSFSLPPLWHFARHFAS